MMTFSYLDSHEASPINEQHVILMTYFCNTMNDSIIAIFALVSALGLIGVVAVETWTIQQVDASGCRTSKAVNASAGRCLH
jgi:uncharacterized membrane protein